MQFITVREFRASTAKFWRKLRKERKLIITRRGKPAALVTVTDEHRVEDTLREQRRQEAIKAVTDIRRESARNGTATMTMEEIDAEIAAARRARRR